MLASPLSAMFAPASQSGAPAASSPALGRAPRAWLFSLSRFQIFFLVLLGSAGMFFGQPNNWAHVPLLVLLYPFCLCLLALGARNAKHALLRCFFLGLTANSATLYWLVHPMHDVAGLPYPAAACCVVLLSVYLGLFPALTGLGMRHIHRFFARFYGEGKHSIGSMLAASLVCGLVYGGYEVLTGWIFTGFPWLSLGSAFAFFPAWVQSASILGSNGLSAVYAAVGCLAAAVFMAHGLRARAAAAAFALFLCAAQPVYGSYRLAGPVPASSGPEVPLLMVQGNVDQNQKWDPTFQRGTLDRYLELSRAGLAEARRKHQNEPLRGTSVDDAPVYDATVPVLVLWPETALPFYFRLHQDYAAQVYGLALEQNVNILFGTLGMENDHTGRDFLFNRVYLLSSRGSLVGKYDKQHLVPFGEYIPLAADFEFLQKLLQGMSYSPGGEQNPLRLALPRPLRDPLADAPLLPTVNGKPQVVEYGHSMPESELSLGTLICYEAIFPYIAQQQVENGASILVNVSNDAWFKSSSAPLQHLSLTAMRAVEQARPIARCTNTGITAVIDSRGRITAHTDNMFEKGYFAASVAPSREITAFHRFFPAHEYLLVIMALLSLVCHTFTTLYRSTREIHVPAN